MSDVAPITGHQASRTKCMIPPAFQTDNCTIDLPMTVGIVRFGTGHSALLCQPTVVPITKHTGLGTLPRDRVTKHNVLSEQKRPSLVMSSELTRPRQEDRGCNDFCRSDSISCPTLDLEHADLPSDYFPGHWRDAVSGVGSVVAGIGVMLPGPGHRVLK